MKISLAYKLAAGAALSVLAVACSPAADKEAANHHPAGHDASDKAEATSKVETADYVDNFSLIDHKGQAHELFYHADQPAIVIMTHGNGCPIVRGAMPDFEKIAAEYSDKGVEFLLLNSNLQDTRDSVAAEAAEYNYSLPIMIDEQQLVGESLGVHRTAEVFVIDPAQGFKVVYHGPIDDRQSYERQKAEAENHFLTDTLDQMIAGEDVTVEGPPLSPGCLVNFPERDRRDEHINISYAEDVAPILLGKCADCHQPGGIGPWAMTSHDVVQGWSPMMREVIRTDRMPPWHADPHVGTFQDDRSLSSDEIKTLVHWIEAGAPRGDGPDPLADANLHAPEWPLGEPDLILTLPAYDVPANGIIDYDYPVVANPLTEDKWIRATSVKAGSRETVHHVLSGYMSEIPEDGRGSTGLWEFSTGGYAVGAETTEARANHGTPMPAGGAIGFQMHYTPIGKPVTDITQIGFYFHDEVPKYVNRTSVVLDASIEIPAGDPRHEETAYLEFPEDAILMSVFPHAHYRGYASDLRIRYPDGKEEMLVSLPKYDFNWQRSYVFEEPVDVPAGSKLIANYIYDNSENNFANPDPNVDVTWGEQTHEEMLYTSLSYRWKDETSDNRKDDYQARLEAGRLFGSMDDNIDGQITADEMTGMLGARMKPAFPLLDKDGSSGLSPEEFAKVFEVMNRRSSGQP
ncbi:redoxin family protein [Henriciella litoralis]|uniref:redoxin family protein n=1 Tax=Henriciella litoralis TaxID=568102 RepID=UPI000A04DD19|nr:redoxin family protein [Henriciella litoralis]